MKKNIYNFCWVILFLPSLVFGSYLKDVSIPEETKKVPKVNVQIYIPSLMFGIVSSDVNFKLSDKITLGPQASYYAYGKDRGYTVGLTMNYPLSGDVFGDRVWLLNPYVLYAYDTLNYQDVSDEKKDGIETGMNLVYQWMWDNGINMRLGAGLQYSSKKPILKIAESHWGGRFLFSLGYAF